MAAVVATLLFVTASARADVRVEAYYGEPIGVGRITVAAARGESDLPWTDH